MSYIVICHKCQARYDALAAPWCHCLSSDRSVECPSCKTCSCKAPAAKAAFWKGAPPEMRERRTQETREAFSAPELPAPDRIKRPLVLVADDETMIQRVATRAIEGLGYGVVVAENGERALELVKLYRPELVLTDALMPKLDGREMARRLKESPETAGIKVVLMTALYKGIKYEQEARKAYRVDDYVTKPLDVEQLRAVLQKHLGAASS